MEKFSLGGQAVLEGVMLRGKKNWVLAIRKPNQKIVVKERKIHSLAEKVPFLKWYLLRGILVLIETLILGVQALSISAQEASEEEAKISPKDIAISLILALVLAIFLFVILPIFITKEADKYVKSVLVLNGIEGSLRIAIFIGYLGFISRFKDILRVFEYHGAEHKVVHTYEARDNFDPKSASKYSIKHVACGTTFLLLVMVIWIFAVSFFGRPPLLWRILSRLIVLPLIAGVSYEIIKLARRHQNSLLVKVIMAPGLWLQKMTTREPSLQQLEVALCSLKKLLALEEGRSRGG